MAAKKLTNEQQLFVVQSLACFDSPKTVADALRKEFGVEITPQTVEAYDPTKRAGAKLAQKWRAIFEATRKSFIDDTSSIGWSHRSTRLRLIQRVGERAEGMGNLTLALQAAEQAAKEMGDAFTNRQKLDHTHSGEMTLNVLQEDAEL
ncbi:DUF2280 domain-containing protein [Ensifer sp. ENS02]|uniref:DUF2280 domain-containing protein n=1 Tax=Ensifer sp. ENS02 TaxID=2769290 RepID=UPI001780B384|nr:DUF2280 domain-containing protein [Ensifer sp. ENS02]MBD9519299.1 DUF2280 domain-containing protein [Ensifer sp. ENS02]